MVERKFGGNQGVGCVQGTTLPSRGRESEHVIGVDNKMFTVDLVGRGARNTRDSGRGEESEKANLSGGCGWDWVGPPQLSQLIAIFASARRLPAIRKYFAGPRSNSTLLVETTSEHLRCAINHHRWPQPDQNQLPRKGQKIPKPKRRNFSTLTREKLGSSSVLVCEKAS